MKGKQEVILGGEEDVWFAPAHPAGCCYLTSDQRDHEAPEASAGGEGKRGQGWLQRRLWDTSPTPAPCPSLLGWGPRGLCPAEHTKARGGLSERPTNPISESLGCPPGMGEGGEPRGYSLAGHVLQVVVEEEKGYRAQSYVINIYLLHSGTGESGAYEVASVEMQWKKYKLNFSRELQGQRESYWFWS